MSSKESPWLMRTYSGHSSALESNALFRKNLAKGQTGLSVAFDLPTQTGYDPDHPLAHGEVGKVGVPVKHIDDMATLFEGIPIETMNTSMTINATAMWLLALYVALGKRRGVDQKVLSGTTQNDILKEYLSRGTHIFPPKASMRLIADMVSYTVKHIPKWNPINICSYHLQEAGATPVQEIAFAMANAIAILDAVKARGEVPDSEFPKVVGRISFFVNAGIRFIEEMCKMRAFARIWDELTQERYGVQEEKYRRFRYGVQVNSLGLTERQPENNVYRVLLEMLAVTLSKDARARAVQLPAWNEALGLPRPWDQQWSLRLQQIVACETDILEYDDIFNGSPVIEEKVASLVEAAKREMQVIEEMGGALAAIEAGYMKRELVNSHARRVQAIESGELTVVGVNAYRETEPSMLTQNVAETILRVDPNVERDQVEKIKAFRQSRDSQKVKQALLALKRAAGTDENLMLASIEAAEAGVTTGEWAGALREVFGEYRAPTGVSASRSPSTALQIEQVREKVKAWNAKHGAHFRILVGKPGLDGHSNGAEQIAVRARDVGMEVVYEGIRLTPKEIAQSALQEGVHVVGLSILSGSHLEIIPAVMSEMKAIGLSDIPIVVGGIIPEEDREILLKAGVSRVYTPKDFDLNAIMSEMVEVA